MSIRIGITDDHQLFLKSLSLMIDSFRGCEVAVEALNGKDLLEKLKALPALPDMILLDVNMPVMDGIETAAWLTANYPAIQLVALSMNDADHAIINMFKAGCCAYLLKDTHPNELEKAIAEVKERGYYNADAGNIHFRRLLMKAGEKNDISVSAREAEFLKAACSDLTYKAIAANMNLSERTIDGYRESLFAKFKVQSRVGLCLEAIRKGFAKL